MTVPDDGTEAQRFAAYEQVVASRTNALVGAGGRLQLPWPRALGTPPWGALNELEFGAADPGGRLRPSRGCATAAARVSSARMPPSAPGCVPAVPRCSTSATPGRRGTSCSSCRRRGSRSSTSTSRRSVASSTCREHAFVERRLAIAGWDVPWAAVWADSTEQIRPRA